MTVVEHGDDLLLVDAGVRLPTAERHGVGTVLFTGDHRFDHTPVDGRPRTSAGSPGSAHRG
jgi:mRNA degradation ribonuclease J1/J2